MKWTPKELLKVKTVLDVKLSPDNQSLVFSTRSFENEDLEKYVFSIFIKDQSGESKFIAHGFQPSFSPDNKWISYLVEENKVKNLYLYSLEKKNSFFLTNLKYSVQTYAWSKDSKKIAFVAQDDLEVIPKTSFSYETEFRTQRLWLFDITTKDLSALTPPEYYVRGAGDFGTTSEELDFSPDSKKIVFAFTKSSGLENYYLFSQLAVIDLESKEITPFKNKESFEGVPRYSPDGKWIAYLSSTEDTRRYSFNRKVALKSTVRDEVRYLADTYNGGHFISGPSLLGWNDKGDSLIFFEPKKTKYHLTSLPIDGSPEKEIKTCDFFFTTPALSFDRKHLAFVLQSPSTPPEAAFSSLEFFNPKVVSELNVEISQLSHPKTETIRWKSKDSLEIEGLLTYPLHYDEKKKYPLLLVIHGGPMGFFEESYLGNPSPYPLLSFAEKGFFVLRPNPRGSTGYGKDFRNANYSDWGGKDFEDLMCGVDFLKEKIIADNLGVMGWSYGGFMTAWMITQTSRFKKASMGAGPVNLVSMSGTCDLPSFMTDYFEGDFIEKMELYLERSPLFHLDKIKIPLLIQHGIDDKRVPVSQAYEFYQSLISRDKKVSLMLFPKMEHRASIPNMYLDLNNQNLNWFIERDYHE